MSYKILEEKCYELLASADLAGFKSPYGELWSMFDGSGDQAERMELAKSIADVTYALGEYYHDRFCIFDLTGAYNDMNELAKEMPESEAAALSCVMLAVGVFELKFHFREFENVESYIDELLPVTSRFEDNEEFTLYSAVCLCNLLQLCPYDMSVFIDCMLSILDRIGELAGRFPGNADLQLCCLRSYTFFLCYGKSRLKDEIFEEYYNRAETAFIANEWIVDESALSDMRLELIKHGIGIRHY